jgi:hypothetical protein
VKIKLFRQSLLSKIGFFLDDIRSKQTRDGPVEVFGPLKTTYLIGIWALFFKKNAHSAPIIVFGLHRSFKEPKLPMVDDI